MTPPALARRLLTLLLPVHDHDAIVGDLDEEFRRLHAEVGSGRATAWYWRQALTSIPAALRLRRRASRRDDPMRIAGRERVLGQIMQDARYTVRGWRREPLFAATAIGTQALGVAVAGAVLSVAYGVLFEALPYGDPGALVRVVEGDRSGQFSYPDFVALRQSTRSLSHVAGFNGISRTLRVPGMSPELVPGAEVTAGFFETLGVVPAQGRTFAESESNPNAPGVVIVTHGAWLRRFGGDPTLVGRTLTLGGQPVTVVGILPADFEFPLRGLAEIWMPLRPSREQLERSYFHWLDVLARRAPGTTDAQVASDLDLVARLRTRDDPTWHASARLRAFSLRDAIVAPVRPALLVLLGGVALLFAAASANVAGLVLARAGARVREMSVRAAIGASPFRLLRQQITESLMLTLVGSVLGLAAADALVRAAMRSLPPVRRATVLRADHLGVTAEIIAITVVLSCAAGIIFGILPWLRRSTVDLQHELTTRTGTGASPRARAFLVAAEISLALMLITGAGLLGRSVYRLSQVSPGFDPKGLLTLRLMAGPRYTELPAREVMRDRLFAALRELPGVKAVATIDQLPLTGRGNNAVLQIAGRSSAGDGPTVLVRTISPNYFDAMRIPLQAGRAFTARDRQGAPPVVIVNQALAAQVFGGQLAIGERIVFEFYPGKPQWEIVGIVGDEQFEELDRQRSPVVYFPYGQDPAGNFSVVLRADAPSSLAAPVRRAVAHLDPQLLVSGVRTMEEIVTQSTAVFFRRAVLSMLGVFALAAVVLAAIGVYGTLAYVVSQRTREIGIRVALGARRPEVVRMMLRRGMTPAFVGSALGVAGSFGLSGFLKSLLFGVQPNDVATLAVSVLFLCAVALVACLVPVLRASRVDPAVTLRHE